MKEQEIYYINIIYLMKICMLDKLKKQTLQHLIISLLWIIKMLKILNNYNISDHVVLKKLTDLIDDTTKENVPDPYYTGNFNETYELVHHGVEGLLKLIKQNKEKK